VSAHTPYATIINILLIIIVAGCTEGREPVSANQDRQFPDGPAHSVTSRPQDFDGTTKDERMQQRAEAIEAILSRTPARDRSKLRAVLDSGYVPSGAADPILAHHASTIASIAAYEWEHSPERARAREREEASRRRVENSVRALVVLSADFENTETRARVVRNPADGVQEPFVILLREHDAMPADLTAGIEAVRTMFRTSRQPPTQATRTDIRAIGTSRVPETEKSAFLAKQIAMIKASQAKVAPGIGLARFTLINVRGQ
jgi:hypothetical protein